MRLLTVGDCHGNGRWIANHVLPQAEKSEADAIVQVGDFGSGRTDREFWQFVEEQLAKRGMTLFWLDGNHEDYDLLKERYALGANHLASMSDHIFYLPRGVVWEWDNTTFMAMGGAYSINRTFTHSTLPWWHEELITHYDIDRAKLNMKNAEKKKIDVLLCHDCPSGPALPGEHAEWKVEFPETYDNRRQLRRIVDLYWPKLVVHGHYHVRYHTIVGPADDEIRIEGLACDGFRNGMAILDTDKLELEDV